MRARVERQAGVWAVCGLVWLAGFAGCAEGAFVDAQGAAEDVAYELVAPGKADNYFSDVSREFQVMGVLTVAMSEEEAADEVARQRRIAERTTAVGLYLTTYLTDKFLGIDIDGDGEISEDEIFFHNVDYGGFHAMVRNRTIDIGSLTPAEEAGEYWVTFTLDVAGPHHFLELLAEAGGEPFEGGLAFTLLMPEGATSDPAFVNRRVVRNFDPETYTGEMEAVRLEVYPHAELSDAYPRYRDLMADGVLDITLFHGHDYNEARWDLIEAREAFDHLVRQGYEPPVERFDELTHESGPFVRTIETVFDPGPGCLDEELLAFVNRADLTVEALREAGVRRDAAENLLAWRAGEDGELGTADDRHFTSPSQVEAIRQIGPVTMERLAATVRARCEGPQVREVRVEVRVFHSDMFEGQRALHRQVAIDELVGRDIFFYNGHAGPYYGFYLDEAGLAQISDQEFAELPFDPNRQQLVVAQGCQTYSQYADMLYANPHRDEESLDVITTVNYSYGQGTLGLFDRLVRANWQGVHQPTSYNDLISGLNAQYWNRQKLVFYGVIGIETNPALHPYANAAGIGRVCQRHADCGANAEANVCVPMSDGLSRCAARTVAERGCPEGTHYAHLASGTTLVGGVCWGL